MAPAQLSVAHAVRAGDFVIERLSAWGIRLQAGSRILRARDQIARALTAATVPSDLSAYAPRLLESYRTVLEFYCITTAIEGPNDSLFPNLSFALSGQELGADDTKTRGRDYQFELLAGSLIRHSGIHGLFSAEPDFRIVTSDREIGVAVKRISVPGEKRVLKRVRQALGHIRRQQLNGIIVLGLDESVAAEMERQPGQTSEQVLSGIVERSREFLVSIGGHDSVYALYGFATTLGVISDPKHGFGVEFRNHASWIAESDEADRIREFLDGRAGFLGRRMRSLLANLK